MQIAILGPLEVRDGDAALDIAGARLRGLLIRLALDAGRPVSAAALADAVWGGDPPADEANALQSLVSRLRRALRGAALVAQSPGAYRLDVAREDVDAYRFERVAREGGAALRGGDHARAAGLLRDALGLWRGPALADADGSGYAVAAATRLAELRLAATADRIEADTSLGRAGEVVVELEGLVAEHPLDERLAGLQLTALCRAGRPADALAAYERLRARLADELGADPSAQLQAIHLAVLRGEQGAQPAAPPRGPRTNLRAQLTSFVGRDDEVARIGKALDEFRLVTLVGPGGAGKTRLASEAATAVLDAAPDGIWFVELASVTDPGDLAHTILGSLGIREAHLLERRAQLNARDAMTRLVDTLVDKCAVLVLDNCEHLLEGCARVSDDLLARCPSLRILTTTREPLGITGEALIVVAPLGLPAPDAPPEDAMRFPAVRLFADRAAAARPDFTLDERTSPVVVQVVRRLDGLPLAIELAAARLRTLPLAEIARRLSDRFRLLTGGSRTALPRHRTLRAVVDWSWDLLAPPERLLAERLAVFPAGATTASASAVCADAGVPEADVADLLSSLVDKSLLAPLADGTRLRMLETIREYGTERLAERGELAGVRARHADYFGQLLRGAQSHLLSAEQLPWFELLRAERDNILAAQRFRCDSGDADGALEIGVMLGGFAMLLGNHAEVPALVEDALRVPGGTDAGLRHMAEALYTMNAVMGSGTDATGANAGDALRAMRDIGAKLDAVDVRFHPLVGLLRVGVAFFTDDAERADRYVAEALATENPWTAASVRMFRASLAENNGDVAAMRADSALALAEFRRLGERWGTASTLRATAMLHTLDGDLDAATEAYTEALALMAEMNSRDDEGFIRVRLADLCMRRGDLDGAREQVELGRAAVETTGSTVELIFTLCVGAAVEQEAGNRDEARRLHEQATRRVDAIAAGHPIWGHTRAMVLMMAIAFAVSDGRLGEARACTEAALAAAIGTKDMPIVAAVGVALARLATADGDPERAARLLGAAATLRGAEDPTSLDVSRLRRELPAALGEQAFRAAYRGGRALAREAAIGLLRASI